MTNEQGQLHPATKAKQWEISYLLHILTYNVGIDLEISASSLDV